MEETYDHEQISPIVKKIKTSSEKSPDHNNSSRSLLNSSTSDSSTTQFDCVEEEEVAVAAAADPLKALVEKRLSELPGEARQSKPVTIYRVPAAFREKRRVLYEPRMVAIGPYYHGREELQSMEDHKWWCLRDFMARKPDIGLNTYLEAIRAVEPRARRCYSETVKQNADDFTLMLLLDGCFVLEYFLKYEDKETDNICDVGWGGPTIVADLFLLENQIPFFVIHTLASFLSDLTDCRQSDDDDDERRECNLVNNLSALLPYQEMLTPPEISCDSIHHLLHLYYICLLPKSYTEEDFSLHNHPTMKRSLSWLWMRLPQQPRDGNGSSSGKGSSHHNSSIIIPCAAELHDSGVKFRRNSSHRLFDITFHNGAIEMPLLIVDNTVRTIFTNLVAFEQSQINRCRVFTSYVVLWNMLVDTARDVSILEHCGILELVQHNEEQAADFFNELADCWSMDYDNHYYAKLFLDLQQYCSSTWHRSRARLMQDYFSNPWSSISVVAGIILLILTVIQTYYTVYPTGTESEKSCNFQ